jgi:hypothetical protein
MATGHDLAQQLLRKTADDEEAARAMLPLESVADTIVSFHAQQAVEKSLKAVLAAREVEFPFTHDIGAPPDQLNAYLKPPAYRHFRGVSDGTRTRGRLDHNHSNGVSVGLRSPDSLGFLWLGSAQLRSFCSPFCSPDICS